VATNFFPIQLANSKNFKIHKYSLKTVPDLPIESRMNKTLCN
jgi:hypothetical protein